MADFYSQTVKEVTEQFSVDVARGLSANEVKKRQAHYGRNAFQVVGVPLWRKLLEPFLDIFMLILIVALILSVVQGDAIEAVAISVIIMADAVIYYIQRFSTDRILHSLQQTTLHDVAVIRDGSERRIDAVELVPGDIVVLHEGDKIPADGRIVQESGLLTDEAMLTGESEPIAKDARAISGVKKVYEQRNMVFSGSFVFTGSGKFVVTATGNDTEYGRIASLASSADNSSPISEKINKLVVKIAGVVVALAVLVLVVQLIEQIPLLDALKFTLAMIVSAVPEGLSIAISIILALCAKRMARKQALIRELKAIESIGVVTTIASDKTGTLTENRLELKEIWTPGRKADFLTSLAEATLLESSQIDADNDSNPSFIDPLDTCILSYLDEQKYPVERLLPLKSYAFDQSIKMSGNLYEDKKGKLRLTLKGAPETILHRSKLDAKTMVKFEAKLADLAGHGYKIVAIASGEIDRTVNELQRLSRKDQLEFKGFIAIADALRPEATAAIRQTNRMGVKIKMVTGDHAGTAYAIGRELGLAKNFTQVLDCSRLGNVSDDDLANLVNDAAIFARVTPEGKFRILQAIKRTELCAMTGDGVNDVPALVGAHVGVAMGDSPSIVQDAGDIVLLDNNFKNIAEAIKESRTVLANIRRMLGYLLATNAGEALTMVGALVCFGAQLLTPIQILWINLVTDSLMVIPIGLEPPEQKVLRQKLEPKNAPILSTRIILRMGLIALLMSSITLVTYLIANNVLHSPEQANTLAFSALVTMQWSSALTARGIYESVFERLKVKNRGFYLALLTGIVLQIAALFGPLQRAIGVVPVPPLALAITSIAAFLIPLIVVEVYKKLPNPRAKR